MVLCSMTCPCVFAIICMHAWVCVSHRGLVGPLHSDSILGPLDVCCRLGPAGHTGQVVRSPSHQQELRGSVNHRVLRGDWRRHTHTHTHTHTNPRFKKRHIYICKCALMHTDKLMHVHVLHTHKILSNLIFKKSMNFIKRVFFYLLRQ